MMKYKIGDKVLIKKDCWYSSAREKDLLGKVVTITKIHDYNVAYPYDVDNLDLTFGDNDFVGKIDGNKLIKESN